MKVWEHIISEKRIADIIEWHRVQNQVEAYNALTGQNIKIKEDMI